MGVPGLFAFLRKRYTQITSSLLRKKDNSRTKTEPTDYLYIDANHILHRWGIRARRDASDCATHPGLRICCALRSGLRSCEPAHDLY
jgi:hypothetical protein